MREKEEDSWLRKNFLPIVSSWLRPRDTGAPEAGRCFFPNPKITFLIDQPDNLVCQICQHSRLVFQQKPEPQSMEKFPDSVPAIMPCGHVAGARCLRRWLRGHETCPFCRQELVYGKCGHRAPPRHITAEEMFLIPTTIPEGGAIPELCLRCYKVSLRASAEARYEACRRRFVQARCRFLTSNSQADATILLHRKADLESIMFDEYHIKIAKAWLASW